MTRRGQVAPTRDVSDLAFHALAHLTLPGHASLYAPRYLLWARGALAEETYAPWKEDAPLLTEMVLASPDPIGIQALPFAFPDLSSLRRGLSRTLAELGPHEIDPIAKRALEGLDPTLVELVRADLALAAEAYADAWSTELHPALLEASEAVAACLDEAERAMPSLRGGAIELATALGPRGRVFGDRIVVGAPLVWNGLEPETSVVLALHERSVSRARGSWAEVEWRALRELARAMSKAPVPLARAHAEWLARLDLGELLRELVAMGQLDEGEARTLHDEREERASLLARLPFSDQDS